MTTISTAFQNTKTTENGDLAYKSTLNPLMDLIFFAEYLRYHPDEVETYFDKCKGVASDEILTALAAYIRDPRYGLGYKDLGRKLLKLTNAAPEVIATAGRFDDLWRIGGEHNIDYLRKQIASGNGLAKKWAPRFGSKNKAAASHLAMSWLMNKQQYGKFIKTDTVESMLSAKRGSEIKFDKIPGLAQLKYANRFKNGEDTKENYLAYLDSLKKGEAKLNVGSMQPYDLYLKRKTIEDIDLMFDALFNKKGFKISCMPIVDTSGSMTCYNDAYGKAIAIGHFLSCCSTYENKKVVSFSQYPQLIDMNGLGYYDAIRKMHTGDCSNTNLKAVMDLLSQVDELPEYLVILTDMEFDSGSYISTQNLKAYWKQKGYKTKIVWWNLNARHMTAPETDDMGNIFMSGYNPMVMQFIAAGFDADSFVEKILQAYVSVAFYG